VEPIKKSTPVTQRTGLDPSLIRSPARRRLLRIAAVMAGGLSGVVQQILAAAPPAAQQGMQRVRGTILVDGKPAQVGTLVVPGATVITEEASEAAYVVGQTAYLQRAGTRVVVGRGAASPLRLIKGALLAVFPPGVRQQIRTPVVTAGIRGTGCYVQLEGRRTYFCLCYGAVELAPDGGQRRSYSTKHHESPFWIAPGGGITRAGFLEHEDAELLESLVGRQLPFAVPYKR